VRVDGSLKVFVLSGPTRTGLHFSNEIFLLRPLIFM
jgi:hypothetical protein